MPRPGGERNFEKSKDFKGSMLRLIKNLSPWKVIMCMALVLAMVSAILALIAPNKLSDFADIIGKGLSPNVEKLGEIGSTISSNLTSDDTASKMITIYSEVNLSSDEAKIVADTLVKLSAVEDKEKALGLILSLPDKVLKYLLTDITVDGVVISGSDQVEMLRLVSQMEEETGTTKALELLDKLPKNVYNLVKPQIDMNAVKDLAVFMGFLYLISALFNFIQSYSLTTVSNRFANKLRDSISKKINRLPLKYFDSHETGDVLSRVTNDVDTVAMNLNNSLATLVTSITLFLGSILMMFITNWIMAITAILSSIIGFVLMFTILSKSQKYFIQRQKELGEMNGYIEEMYSGHNVVKVYNGTKEAFKVFDELNAKLYTANRKSQFLSGMMHPIMGFVGNFGYVMVCIVGALLTMNDVISFGVIVAFMIYVRMFTNPLNQIAQVKPGQKIAIVGPTGAGKTTMVNLLMKFYEINNGHILIDGVPTSELTRENVRSLFLMVLQDTWLFEGTIGENIKFNKEKVSDKEVWDALKTVGVDHFVKTLPGGLDYKIGDNDVISQGQKQLLTIARGMVEDAPFLILDEATSNVDTRTEELVQKAMDKLTEGRTSFIIAHRLSTIKNADLILVMNEGNIIEQGTHDELLKKGEFYAGLYNSQFELGGE